MGRRLNPSRLASICKDMTSVNVDIFPSIGARLKASVIDSVVIILLVVLLATIYTMIGHESPMVSIVLFSVVMGYEPILVWKRGMTIGHQLMGFRVIDTNSKTKLTLPRALLRFLIKGVLGIFLLSGRSLQTHRRHSMTSSRRALSLTPRFRPSSYSRSILCSHPQYQKARRLFRDPRPGGSS
jgi:uncharacterized RDD family membrane protein YckC